MEGAKIHAENAIRQKNQALNYRRMSARIDAVAARVQTAVTTKQVRTVRVHFIMWTSESQLPPLGYDGFFYRPRLRLTNNF